MSSVDELVQNIVSCGYECEAGPLENNMHFRELVQKCKELEDELERDNEVIRRMVERDES